MPAYQDEYKIQVLHESMDRLQETGNDYKRLLDLVGNASIVLLGEATHGTHEFYRERAQITQLLIKEKNFKAIAIEGDWPDAYRVNKYICGQSEEDKEASDALQGFTRFPNWMWANADMLDFIGWLREYNETISSATRPIGFYGLDLYSLFRSIREVVHYLEKVDKAAAERARERYACFDHFGENSQKYAYATGLGLESSCEQAVLNQLVDLLKNEVPYRQHLDGALAEEAYFNAAQNTKLVRAAEEYYRTMLNQDVLSWNLRDRHMMETLKSIRNHLVRIGEQPKVVVWAHNSHVGNALATDMHKRGEYNIGQLAKAEFGSEVINIGFTTYFGTVTAASSWDGIAERKHIRPAPPGSYENLFHQTRVPRFFLDLKRKHELANVLRPSMLERAIGVLYLSETERLSHYFYASLSEQFDGVIHMDHTRAVKPLEHTASWKIGEETPEAYPSGF